VLRDSLRVRVVPLVGVTGFQLVVKILSAPSSYAKRGETEGNLWGGLNPFGSEQDEKDMA